MSAPNEMVKFCGKLVRRFVSFPEPITDGTIRCGICGQLDDEEFHDSSTCQAIFDSNCQARRAECRGEGQ